MVLDVHRHPLFGRIVARPSRHRPAQHDAVELEPEVVVQPARPVLLDDERQATCCACGAPLRHLGGRLGRDPEIALLLVARERGVRRRAGSGMAGHCTRQHAADPSRCADRIGMRIRHACCTILRYLLRAGKRAWARFRGDGDGAVSTVSYYGSGRTWHHPAPLRVAWYPAAGWLKRRKADRIVEASRRSRSEAGTLVRTSLQPGPDQVSATSDASAQASCAVASRASSPVRLELDDHLHLVAHPAVVEAVASCRRRCA